MQTHTCALIKWISSSLLKISSEWSIMCLFPSLSARWWGSICEREGNMYTYSIWFIYYVWIYVTAGVFFFLMLSNIIITAQNWVAQKLENIFLLVLTSGIFSKAKVLWAFCMWANDEGFSPVWLFPIFGIIKTQKTILSRVTTNFH